MLEEELKERTFVVSRKYRLIWLLFFSILAIVGFLWNTEYWVSMIEALIYMTSGIYDQEKRKYTADIVFVVLALPLSFILLAFPSRFVIGQLGVWILMVLLVLGYLPFVYDNTPEIGF